MGQYLWRGTLEANQSLQSRSFADGVVELLGRDFAVSRELRIRDWRRRSPAARARERFWGWVEDRGTRLAYRRRIADAVRRRGGDPRAPDT